MSESSDDDNPPTHVSGHSFEGWRLERNAHRIGDLVQTLFLSADEAKRAATELSAYPLTWIECTTDPQGNAYFQGGHPEMMELERRYKHAWSSDELQKKGTESDELMRRLGHAAWWDRWYVEPEYAPIITPVPHAIKPLPQSPYYAAPHSSWWAAWREGISDPVEGFLSREEAIEAASRLALGFKTAATIRRNRFQFFGLIAYIFAVTTIVTVLYWLLRFL